MIIDLKTKIIISVLATIIDIVVLLPLSTMVLDNINAFYWGVVIVGILVLLISNSVSIYLKSIVMAWNVGSLLGVFPITLFCSIFAALCVGLFGVLFPVIPILLAYCSEKRSQE